jgi:hypothetical protein
MGGSKATEMRIGIAKSQTRPVEFQQLHGHITNKNTGGMPVWKQWKIHCHHACETTYISYVQISCTSTWDFAHRTGEPVFRTTVTVCPRLSECRCGNGDKSIRESSRNPGHYPRSLAFRLPQSIPRSRRSDCFVPYRKFENAIDSKRGKKIFFKYRLSRASSATISRT